MNEIKLTELEKDVTKKTIAQFIVNGLGINLSSVKDIRVSRQTDGQMKDIHIVFNPSYVNGSQKLVAEWQANNPHGKKVDCYRDTGVSRPTIDKYWNSKGKWINHRNDHGHNIADCSECGKAMQWHDEDEDGVPRYCWYCGSQNEL